MKRRTVALASVAVLAASAAAIAVVRAQSIADLPAEMFPYTDAAAVAEGQTLYEAHCAACHGANLEGEDDWRSPGPDGRLPAPPHDETGHTWHHPDAQLFMITKYGTEAMVGGNYRSNMIGFEDILTDDEIIAVLAYIKSSWPEQIRVRHTEMNRARGG